MASRSPEVTAAASSVGISGMAETVAEGSVTYNVSAFRNSSSIDSCGVGSSRVVRNAFMRFSMFLFRVHVSRPCGS